jgi:hypothetical protein
MSTPSSVRASGQAPGPRRGRSRRVAALLVALVAVALPGGCKDSHKDDAKTSRPTKVADIDGLAAVPADARVVIGADVEALAASRLVRRGVRQMLARDPGLQSRLESIAHECALDVRTDLARVIVAIGTEPDQVVLVAEGRFDEAHLAACVGKSMHAVGGELTTARARGRTLYHARSTDASGDVWFALGSADTAVVSASRAWLDRALDDSKNIRDNEAIAGLIDRAGPGAALWAAGRVDPVVGKGLVDTTGGAVKSPPRAAFGHAELEDGLHAELGVQMATAADATAAVSFARPQLDTLSLLAQKHRLGRLVRHLRIDASGSTVTLRLEVGADELGSVLSPIDTGAATDENPQP